MLTTINDFKTMELFRSGKTEYIPYFEEGKTKALVSKIQPNSLEDLCAIFSLDRGCCQESLHKYISNKSKPENIKYAHSMLEKHLKPTFGILIYNEQVKAILEDFADFYNEESNLVCKAMGKKHKNDLDMYHLKFEVGCLNNSQFMNEWKLNNCNIEIIINEIWNYLCDAYCTVFSYTFAVKTVSQSYWIAYNSLNN